MIIDYTVAKECSNSETFYTCYQCGKCGRVFDEDGIMIDDGGTTVADEEDEEIEKFFAEARGTGEHND